MFSVRQPLNNTLRLSVATAIAACFLVIGTDVARVRAQDAYVLASMDAMDFEKARPPSGSPAGEFAYTCGVMPAPANAEGRRPEPVFPPGQYPVDLPAMSLLGAPNEGLPNAYEPGVDWGELPLGRRWGSTASVTTGPDGHIWVIDRCDSTALGGDGCAGANANVNPIFEFDPSGELLNNFGAGLFGFPHKMFGGPRRSTVGCRQPAARRHQARSERQHFDEAWQRG